MDISHELVSTYAMAISRGASVGIYVTLILNNHEQYVHHHNAELIYLCIPNMCTWCRIKESMFITHYTPQYRHMPLFESLEIYNRALL